MKSRVVQLSLFPLEEVEVAKAGHVINVASVPQRSPFRYPGGKTWLIPTARKWFAQAKPTSYLIEPFAGGGIVSLTAVAEHYFEHVTMIELDDDMAAAWQVILSDECQWLANQIANFKVTAENVNYVISHASDGIKEHAFSTIVRNRTNHGGILAKGSGVIKNGENGKGLNSRWYPGTLIKRIYDINNLRKHITFIHGDAFKYLEKFQNDEDAFFFIDPPYTIAGRRLYNHYMVDHARLFRLASHIKGHFLMTYDDTPEIRGLADDNNLQFIAIPMQTTHLITKNELLISKDFEWYGIRPDRSCYHTYRSSIIKYKYQ